MELTVEKEVMNKGVNVERETSRFSNSNNHHLDNILEDHMKANAMDNPKKVGESSSLKDLCVLLLSSFCGILDEFGLETRADEDMLLLAVESGDFDSVIEYVKLFKNKISSILLLNNIGRDSKTDIGMTMAPEVLKGMGDMESESSDFVEATMSGNNEVTSHHTKQDIVLEGDFRTDLVVNNSEYRNLKPSSPGTSNNVKKSPVPLPPLNIEKAGPGSWNRGQLPNEYPTEK